MSYLKLFINNPIGIKNVCIKDNCDHCRDLKQWICNYVLEARERIDKKNKNSKISIKNK